MSNSLFEHVFWTKEGKTVCVYLNADNVHLHIMRTMMRFTVEREN